MKKQKLVVLSGAGVSAESGIKTYRDNDGLWENYPVEQVASIEGWYRDKALMLRFYNERRRQLATTKPNRAHEIIAELEHWFDVVVVTQNVDDLHERAGSSNVIHLHGELTKARPEDRDPEMGGGRGIVDIGYKDLNLGDRDSRGVQMRPHIVWFGEAVPMIEPAAREVSEADILLIIGTSLVVYPAAGLVRYARPGVPVYVIDPKPVSLYGGNITQIQEPATVGMARFRDMVIPIE